MLKKSKEFLRLSKSVKKLLSDEIVDIVIFGSSVKEKSQPGDIDIAIIFRHHANIDIIKKFQDALGEKCHVSAVPIDHFFTKSHSLAKTILFEGISLLTNKPLSENFDLKPFVLYTYDLSKQDALTKVKFVYLLKGRTGDGLIKNVGGRYISPSSFIVPVSKDEEILEVFKTWNIKFYREKIMLVG